METVEWLTELLGATGARRVDLARTLNVRKDTITNLLNGSRKLRSDEMLLLSKTYRFPLPVDGIAALTEADVNHISHRPVTRLRILGTIAAGVWTEMEQAEAVESVSYLIDPRWNAEDVFGLRVRGESINRKARDGDLVAVLKLEAAPRDFRDGDWVVVKRTRGGLHESTVKCVRGKPGAWELWPSSDDPRHQEPILLSGDEDTTVEVVGFVIDFISPGTKFF
jgi:SOS-response transcriptional repressor LexA